MTSASFVAHGDNVRIVREESDHRSRCDVAHGGEDQHQAAGKRRCRRERLADPVGVARAGVLTGDRRHGKSQRNDRKKARLDDSHADSKACLGSGTERPADHVNDEQIHSQQRELGTGRKSNLQHLSP